ncbi:hypothetical protein pEaSNUABM25_00223 [Erwinia phage pEa_SNUABM_25]|nr:hypothetical protein pEaSNUABM25_00223 [Erwinia phage pEa_SNUABM_25]
MNIELETHVMNMLAGISRHLVKLGRGDVAAYQDRFFFEYSFNTPMVDGNYDDVVAKLREKIVAELAVRDIALTEDYQPVLTYRPMVIVPASDDRELVVIVVGFPLDAPVVLP